MNIEQLEQQRKELVAKKRELCKQSTQSVVSELDSIEEQIRLAKITEAEKHAETWKEMALQVGDMFRMAFELYTLKDVDIKLRLANHVQWVEFYDNQIYNYSEYSRLVPCKEEFQIAYDEVLEIYNKELGE